MVLHPGWGDTIQANKTGLTKAGDVFVINEVDKPGATQSGRDLMDSLALLQKLLFDGIQQGIDILPQHQTLALDPISISHSAL